MIELERTYLAKYLPEGIKNCKAEDFIDIYFPKTHIHPKIRVRKRGDKYEITKKQPVTAGDASRQEEQTIILNESEFKEFEKLDGKKTHKMRYYYTYQGMPAEIDVFQRALNGLVLIDFEFKTVEEKNHFIMPSFCLVEVTQEEFIAGGMICGKSYKDIEDKLNTFHYSKILPSQSML
ncbi:hypothetical protein IIA95_01680 [Patescibacteria group bacterium]|nr:hypothetical protein [Patescibacteria group bacterium]